MKKAFFLLICLIFITACSSNDTKSSLSCELFCTSSDDTVFINSEKTTLTAETLPDAAKEAFGLLKTPKKKRFKAAIPQNVALESAEFSDAVMRITLSSEYGRLSPAEHTVTNACITRTLCSIDGIEQVFISCEGMPSALYSPESFVIERPHVYYSTQTINLYFADEDFDMLVCETATVSISENESDEFVAISNLILGPKTRMARSAIPEGTALNDIYIDEGVCVIDLTREFVDNADHTSETAEAVTLFSIVNTMTELPLVNSVRFLIDGEAAEGFTYFDISEPLTNSSDLFN